MKRIAVVSFFILLAGQVYAGPILDALEKNDIAAAKRLIKSGANVNETKDRLTVLNLAAYIGNLEIVDLLLKKGAKMTDADMFFAITGLPGSKQEMEQYGRDRGAIVALLVSKGANVNGSHDGQPHLITAAEIGHVNVVKALIENGADVNVRYKGKTALQQMNLLLKNAGQSEFHDNYRQIIALLKKAGAK